MPTQHNRMTKFCMVSKLFTGLRWSVVKVTDLHPAIPKFCWYPRVAGGGRKGIWPKLLPCTSKSPTSVGTSEPSNKEVNDVKFGCFLTTAPNPRGGPHGHSLSKLFGTSCICS